MVLHESRPHRPTPKSHLLTSYIRENRTYVKRTLSFKAGAPLTENPGNPGILDPPLTIDPIVNIKNLK